MDLVRPFALPDFGFAGIAIALLLGAVLLLPLAIDLVAGRVLVWSGRVRLGDKVQSPQVSGDIESLGLFNALVREQDGSVFPVSCTDLRHSCSRGHSNLPE